MTAMNAELTVGRRTTFFHALAFVIGFSLVFVALGASVAFVGYALNTYLRYFVKIGGVILIVFGLQVAGLFAWFAERVRRSGGSQSGLARAYLAFEEGLARLM